MEKNTIFLKKYVDIQEEYEASGIITPGMLVALDANGKVKAHGTAGGFAVPMIAIEDSLQGRGISDNYAIGERVQVWVPVRGEVAYMPASATVKTGDFLVSDGEGGLAALGTEGVILAQALEDASAERSQIAVRIV